VKFRDEFGYLNKGLGSLTELQYLYLSGCHKIDAFPESLLGSS
jgi:hypothetical protein